ncbi:hypothetical protein Sru01_30890 [Sphaerisporangium rufum]|uniref:Uncharacterized protein n=1 Tax=Sphaerisporangium rufum TaxID=1381558 RepID=A0A919R1S9_9ACTN|nr:hypothetical protein Sru01_30890 [Sphaerisporangium rufum]
MPYSNTRCASMRACTSLIDVIGDAIEVDDGSEHTPGVGEGLDQAGDDGRLPDPEEPRPLVRLDIGALTPRGSTLERSLPIRVLGVNGTDGGGQVGDLARDSACDAPFAYIVLAGRLLAVLDLADLRWWPSAQFGKASAGQSGVAPEIT